MSVTLQQGHLDGACGFYATINAINEVNGMSLARCQEVFKQFIAKHSDWSSRFVSGLHFQQLKTIVGEINELLTDDEKVVVTYPFATKKFTTTAEFGTALRAVVTAGQSCALLGFSHPWNHWTVAKNVTDKSIVFKDSTHYKSCMLKTLTIARNDGSFEAGTIVHPRQVILFKKAI